MTISDEELFKRAIEDLEKGDMYGAKYGPDDEKINANFDAQPKKESAASFWDVVNASPGSVNASLTKISKQISSSPKPRREQPSRFSEKTNTTEHSPKNMFAAPELPPEAYEDDGVDSDDFAHIIRYDLDKITRHDNSKYYEQKPSHWSSDYELEPIQRTIVTEPLPTDDAGLQNVKLMRKQGELLERYAKEDEEFCSEICLRNLKLNQALTELKDEIEYAYRKEKSFVRVITGKGRHSKTEGPVIKKGAIQWLEQEGYKMVLGYAPEISNDGNYGSIVVEIRERVKF